MTATGDIARQAVDSGIRRYCAACRERVPGFVDRHFSLRGTLALHRSALGWDVVRTPVNLTLAAPAAVLHLASTAARRLGAQRLAEMLGRPRLLLRTSVVRRVEWLICTELLELPCQSGDEMATRDALAETIAEDARLAAALRALSRSEEPLVRSRLQRMLAEYGVTRSAASEIATAVTSLGTGVLTFGKLTPGVVSFGPVLAAIVAQQAAITSFPLGTGLGTWWYGLFPAAPSPLLLFGFSAGLLMIGSVLAAFAGIAADPIQRRLGVHQRRLRRMIDAMERQMLDPAARGYAVRDRYVARVIDMLDLATAAYRLAR